MGYQRRVHGGRIFQFLKENILKMVAAFPLAKLGVLVIKQISKPLANSIARRARTNDFFRNWILLPTSQLFHWADVKVRMRILNLGKVTKVPKLDEKKAIDTGAQLLSEFIILSIASGILIWEYRRQSAKDEAKQIELEREKRELRDHVNHITFTVEEQAAQLRELSRITLALKDDLEKASQKNSGFFGLGKSKDEKAETKPVNYEANDDNHHRPISSAVLKMSLTSV